MTPFMATLVGGPFEGKRVEMIGPVYQRMMIVKKASFDASSNAQILLDDDGWPRMKMPAMVVALYRWEGTEEDNMTGQFVGYTRYNGDPRFQEPLPPEWEAVLIGGKP